jgi:hypothetical protein
MGQWPAMVASDTWAFMTSSCPASASYKYDGYIATICSPTHCCKTVQGRAKRAFCHDRHHATATRVTGASSELELSSHSSVRWMKRTLVSYGESSTSESEDEAPPPPKKRPKPSSSSPPSPPPNPPPPPTCPKHPPTGTKQQRKRKLPALAAHLAPSVPTDDPTKHQGRTRTTPHVEGQWAAYVYVPIALRGTALRRVVQRAVGIAERGGDLDSRASGAGGVVPVHDTCTLRGRLDDVRDAGDGAKCGELHISLTRPFFLRGYQREEMKRAVRDVAKAHPP